jgi:hypothetical protein
LLVVVARVGADDGRLADLVRRGGQAVAATNDAVAGYTTGDVLRQLDSLGANDVAYSKSCGADVGCYAPRVPTIEQNLDAIVSRHDETHYLASDGDHPNAAGQEKIAIATLAVIEKSLHL